ncbi:hypothetical protein ACH5RR_006785 [Cinchona calisaya]|uniref:Uncharacterized protein n=1 Tax=Cinchona calisaya TaxID=153742 RepID=A0ABD3APX7_9GENT
MAMARLISQTLTHHKSYCVPLSPRILAHRHRSGKPHTAQIVEVDLDSSSSSSSSSSTTSSSSPSQSDAETINGGIKKLEEVIQNIIVRRSAPDWLPFRPGSSYWVPPPNHRNHPYGGVVEVIGRLSTAARLQSEGQIQSRSQGSSSFQFLSEDETMSFSSSHGWPSTSYFIEGSAPTYPVPVEVEVEVEVKVLDNSKGASTGEDDE